MREKVRLARLSEVAALNPRLEAQPAAEARVSFVPMASVSAELARTVRVEERRYADVAKGYTPFAQGDLLVAKITPCFENGKIAEADIPHTLGFGSTEFHVVRPHPDRLHGGFLLHFLRQDWVRRIGQRRMTGSAGQKRVPEKFLADLEVPVPTLPEQRRVASLLDRAEKVVDQRRAGLRLVGELPQAIFYGEFGDSRHLPSVPLETLAAEGRYALSSGPFGSNLTSKDYVDEGVLVLRGQNVTGDDVDLTECRFITREKARELERSKVLPGDVVIVAVGSSGCARQIPGGFPDAVMSQNFNKVSPNPRLVDSTYLSFALNSRFVQRQFRQGTTDTVRTFLSLTKVKRVSVPLPPLTQQREFTQRVEASRRLRQACTSSLAKSEALLASLRDRAFMGVL